MKKNPKFDEYIKKAQPFAQPILKHLRKIVHEACPDLEEVIKWGMPHFDFNGEMLCNMAAFKQHAIFGFWKMRLMKDPKGYLQPHKAQGGGAMGSLGRIEDLKELPPDKVLKDFIKQAMKLNDEGVKVEKKPVPKKGEVKPPAYFMAALKKNKKALATYEGFPLGQKREYVTWVTEAKTEATRDKRLATAVEWMAEGKIRNWKYVK